MTEYKEYEFDKVLGKILFHKNLEDLGQGYPDYPEFWNTNEKLSLKLLRENKQ